MQIIGLERHRGVNERIEWLGTDNLDEVEEEKAKEYAEHLRQLPYPSKEEQVENLRKEVAQRGLVGIKTKEGTKPYLSYEGAVNAFREDSPDAGIDLELIEDDDTKAVFKATITYDGKILSSAYGKYADDRFYFEKAQTKAVQKALKNLGYNTLSEIADLSEQGYDMLPAGDTSTVASIPENIGEREQGIDLIELADQTRRRTRPASEKQVAIITKNVDAGTISKYFGKNPHLLTDGEASLCIKACFGEIDWDEVEQILSG